MKAVALLTVILAIPAVRPVAADPPIATRREAPFPVVADPPGTPAAEGTVFHVLRGDFHIHTPHSDGKLSPAERVTEAWRYGYDVIAITDHGNFRAYDEAVPHAEALGLILLRGIETGIAGQEHLVANLVDVRLKGDAEVGRRLQVENRGPVALEAALKNILEEAITLEPYQKVLLPLDATPESIRIQWNNLWIRPTDNLTTMHPLKALP